ncbi:unnamed protein product [Polarella glacialis]|uniref:Uncharacterized protein n=1 Tax=Polarella glacialis TaxID=89957 RepID=A0A813L910_POLGL|nr:unnamed protein product [Polarella glacialis]CAE8721978.1 unnamed protein product [Polarella glacialis]
MMPACRMVRLAMTAICRYASFGCESTKQRMKTRRRPWRLKTLVPGSLVIPRPAKATHSAQASLWKFVEEFDAPLGVDTAPIWTWSDGGLPEGQVRFAKEQVRFESGNMKIVAEPISDAIHTQPCSKAEVGNVSSKKLVSGEIRARYNQFRWELCCYYVCLQG